MEENYMSNKSLSSLIEIILGAIGLFYGIFTISNDTSGFFRYTYTPPFTQHELFVIAITICSVIILLLGIIKMKKENSNSNNNGDMAA
jgi:hypothetical protein